VLVRRQRARYPKLLTAGPMRQGTALQPTIGVHSPLVFDLVDTWMERSMGGCQYHVTLDVRR
jgi:uncharacterized protein (DUF2126 family)